MGLLGGLAVLLYGMTQMTNALEAVETPSDSTPETEPSTAEA